MEQIKEKLLSTGVNIKCVNETVGNKQRLEIWLKVIDGSKLALPCDKKFGNLFYDLTTKIAQQALDHIDPISQLIADGSLNSKNQIDFAMEYCKKLTIDQPFSLEDLKKASGIGIVITEQNVRDEFKRAFDKYHDELKTWRYAVKKKDLIKEVTDTLKFADGKVINDTYNKMIEELLGPKTKEDDELIKKRSKLEADKESEDKKKTPSQKQQESANSETGEFGSEPRIKISELLARDLADSLNTTKTAQWRQENFGDQILTRFPPEPNGYLHIGHAKSMRFQFKLAREYNGNCYLRFDDTNPEAECQEYIDNIIENVSWLGYKPWKTTFASDNFKYLFDFAVQLIKKGKAFVCHQTKDEMKLCRENATPSPYRNRPIEENLKLFLQMKAGVFEEGKAMLRAKIDYQSPNTTLRDPVIYRIRYTPHPHAKNEWCVYPLYDFTHGICDSLEGISHSICTLEFEIRRELYYWFLKELDLYRPYVWEFSRLNISNNVVSKRKLRELVEKEYVKGWDDPRLLTLIGMRRRGYPAISINEFCDILSVTRSGNENIISFGYLEFVVRKELDVSAKRTLAVIDPVLVTLTNLADDFVKEIQAPDFPKEKDGSTHTITLTKKIYVEREDIQDFSHKDFYGLAPGQITGLKYGCVIKVSEVKKNDKGVIVEVLAEADLEMKTKPKAFMNWISAKDSIACEVRLYDVLFNDSNPAALGDKWLDFYNKESLVVKNNSLMNVNLLGSPKLTTFQFERQGFFTVDYDTNADKKAYIWNRVTKLSDNERLKALQRIQQSKQ